MDPRIARAEGDGGSRPASADWLRRLKDEVEYLNSEIKTRVASRKVDARNTLLAYWAGQAPDGLKHEDYIGERPKPFPGATDTRVRLADEAVRERVELCTLAAMRAELKLKGNGASDEDRARRATQVLRWVIRNQLGLRWIEALTHGAQLKFGDHPGVALVNVWWREDEELRLERVTIARLLGLYAEQVSKALEGMDEREAAALSEQAAAALEAWRLMLLDPEIPADVAAEKLLEFFPTVRPERARKAVGELRKRGETEFPVRGVGYRGVDVEALEWGRDWFCPLTTQSWDRCWCWFRQEWLSETDLRMRETSHGYERGWVDEVLKHEGEAGFIEWEREMETGAMVERSPERYRGLYCVVTAYVLATNDDGVLGRYYVTLHMQVDGTAHERRLIALPHGGWPGVVWRRELLSRQLLDSRGIPDVAGPWQGFKKLLLDTWGDSAQLCGVPPLVTTRRRGKGRLLIEPLQELEVDREGSVKFLDPPQYPQTIVTMEQVSRRMADEYLGRRGDGIDPGLVRVHEDWEVQLHLTQVREVLKQVWALAQAYMPEEELERITDAQGERVARSWEEIRGQYDVELVYDARDMDPEYLQMVAGIVKDVLMPMDQRKTLDASAIVARLFARLLPDLADGAVRPVELAQRDEMEDELEAYLKIRGGDEPELPDDGSVDYETRKQFYELLQGANPEAFADMAPDKMERLQSRLQRMETLGQQFGANVQIGRQGGKTAAQRNVERGVRSAE
jgi:hypothetical protein